MYAGQPIVCAASASAPAWLPLLCVTTPRSRCSSSSIRRELMAPRNLNAPPFWNVSHLKKSSTASSCGVSLSTSDREGSMRALSVEHVCTGVTLA